jgi:hypothetical protein
MKEFARVLNRGFVPSPPNFRDGKYRREKQRYDYDNGHVH